MIPENDIIFTTSQSEATGNIVPLLHEIRHALITLLDSNAETVIDLRRLPLSPEEEEKLETFLGTGEVKADISALGDTTILESRYSGVWLETHYNEASEVMGKYICVARVPAIVLAQPEDMALSVARLAGDLGQLSISSKEIIS
tara:strand:+ start:291 stop:722 length:432 start_codon:yes stop_codon:yes gene_type:complete